MGKSIVVSKTVWVNVIMLLLGTIALTQGMAQFEKFGPWLLFGSGILNLVLRVFFTSQPITTLAGTPQN